MYSLFVLHFIQFCFNFYYFLSSTVLVLFLVIQTITIGYLLGVSLFLEIGLYWYKLPSFYQFYCIPGVLICHIMIFIYLCVFWCKLFFSFGPVIFSGMMCTLHIFVSFFTSFLQLISNFKTLWSENMLVMILIFLNLLRLVLWPSIWSVLEDIPRALEKNVWCSGKKVSINVNYVRLANVSFKAHISLLIFCLDDLSESCQWSI